MALSLASRLKAVEQELRNRDSDSEIRVFSHDQLVPCARHDYCYSEQETGEHHSNVIVLSWKHRE